MKKTIGIIAVLVALSATADVTDRIHKNAEAQWPGDYKMQQYEIQKQTAARNKWEGSTRYSNVPTDVVAKLREAAEAKWGDDFAMRMYELEGQIAAWRKLNNKN